MSEKPPLGIMPRYIWNTRRMADILDAMERYTNARKAIPVEWLIELRELINSEMFCVTKDISEVEHE